jgi:hypothetical protein
VLIYRSADDHDNEFRLADARNVAARKQCLIKGAPQRSFASGLHERHLPVGNLFEGNFVHVINNNALSRSGKRHRQGKTHVSCSADNAKIVAHR